jgi:thiol-disulfide isomerase/thioredoxin
MTPSLSRTATWFLVVALLLLSLPAAAEDRAVCAVCGPREGSGFEPVKATATYKGEQYFFCSTKCKVEFLRNPGAFLVTDAGKPAPPFRLRTFDGKDVSLDAYRGHVVLLDFWATFCPPCLAALPELQGLHARHSARDFVVIGVTVDDRAALVHKATTRAGVAYPIVRATPEVWNAYKVTALPSLILVGRDGNIIRRYGGEADKAAMLADIETALRAPRVAGR